MDRQRKELVLVLGPRHSGGDLLSGILQFVGFRGLGRTADNDEPLLGPAEPAKWVTGLHERLLDRSMVEEGDARPVAWSKAAKVAGRPAFSRKLRTRLIPVLTRHRLVVVDDSRLHWFYPMWRDAGDHGRARVSTILMLRHPAEIIATEDGPVDSFASTRAMVAWINAMVYSERATRGTPRAVVPYRELGSDWTAAIARAAESLDIDFLADCGSTAVANAEKFVARTHDGNSSDHTLVGVHPEVSGLADRVLLGLNKLAIDEADEKAQVLLDECRAEYLEMYETAEAVAASTAIADVHAESRARTPTNRTTDMAERVWRRLPDHWRDRVPDKLRMKPTSR